MPLNIPASPIRAELMGTYAKKAERPPSSSSIPMIRIRRSTVCSRRCAVAKCPAQTRRHHMTAGKNSPYPGRPSETHKQIVCGKAAGSGRKTVRRQHERLQSGVSPRCRSPAVRPLTGGIPTPLCSGFGIWDCRLFDVRKPLQFLPDGTTIVEIVSISATPYRCEVKREGAHAAAWSLFHLPTR
jgi:hypothetical protein